MSETETPNQTPPQTPPPTGDAPAPTAPEVPSGDGAPDETVTVSKKVLEGLRKSNKDLLSQRDRENGMRNQSEAFLGEIAQERHIDSFLSEKKDKYPDLTRDDLMHVDDPDLLEAVADRLQNRISEAAQKRLMEIQNPATPKLSPEDKAQQLKELVPDGRPVKGAFQRFLKLQSR